MLLMMVVEKVLLTVCDKITLITAYFVQEPYVYDDFVHILRYRVRKTRCTHCTGSIIRVKRKRK